MSRSGEVTLDWADGQHVFRLAWGDLIKLQEECDAGPSIVLQRLRSGYWKMQDISSTIRLALVGGGLEPAKAIKLVHDYVEERPPAENVVFAQGILAQAIFGAPDEPPGESEAAPETESA